MIEIPSSKWPSRRDHDEVARCACRSTRTAWWVLAEVLEQHGGQVFGGLLALFKQLLNRQFLSQCSETIESSVKRHLEYWGEIGVHLYQTLALLLLLIVVVGNVASRYSQGKSLKIRVMHTTMKYPVRATLRYSSLTRRVNARASWSGSAVPQSRFL